MSTDLEQRIALLASAWDEEAPPISLAEITVRRHSIGAPLDVPAGTSSDDAVVVGLDAPGRRPNRTRRSLAVAAAVVVVAVGAGVLALRSPDEVEPSSPVTTVPEPDAAAPGIDVPTPSTAPPATAASVTTPDPTVPEPSSPTLLPAAEVEARLAEIEAEQRVALRQFTTIGFRVERTQLDADGAPVDMGGSGYAPGRVVFRNDGSAAFVADDGSVASYHDATTGATRGAWYGPDGVGTFQQIDGLSSSHLAIGMTAGLSNGVVVLATSLSPAVVAIEEDLVEGRPSWRIDQDIDWGLGATRGALTSTWIDRATGITVKTRTSGSTSVEIGGEMFAITDTITLSDLVPGEPMPSDFPSPFPPGTEVAVSGDPFQYGLITYEAAAAELGPGTVVPTLDADLVVVERIVMGEGLENTGISLVARWFDGFAVTELRVMRFPAMMEMTDSCASCTEPLLEQVRAAPITDDGITVAADGFQVSITGDPERIRSIIDSLVTVG